jgi:hypothetical protein
MGPVPFLFQNQISEARPSCGFRYAITPTLHRRDTRVIGKVRPPRGREHGSRDEDYTRDG